MRVDLNCPFHEKDQAKHLGARWDADLRVWYVSDKFDLAPFKRWLHFTAEETQQLERRRKALRAQKKADKREAKQDLKPAPKKRGRPRKIHEHALETRATQKALFEAMSLPPVPPIPSIVAAPVKSPEPVIEHAPYIEPAERKPFDAEAAAIIAMARITKHINQSSGAHLRWFKQGKTFHKAMERPAGGGA